MLEFKVGDKVQVENPGNTYSSYDRMFVDMGFNNTKVNREFKEGMVATVFAIAIHPTTGVPLLGLQAQDGLQCLIGTDGVLKVISTTEVSPDEKFDIITIL